MCVCHYIYSCNLYCIVCLLPMTARRASSLGSKANIAHYSIHSATGIISKSTIVSGASGLLRLLVNHIMF